MSQSLTLKVSGLYTNANPLSAVPQGALSRADNISIDKDGIAEPRRGFDRLPYSFAGINDRAKKLFVYQDKILAHYTGDKLAYFDSALGWTDYIGTFPGPFGNRVRAAEANSNLYFTTSSGVKVIDSFSSTPVGVGVPQGLDVLATTTGAAGFMPTASQVAYRVVWGIRDLNNNLQLSAPSQRGIAVNTSGGFRDVIVSTTIPDSITVNHFFQVYRSEPSAGATTEPRDELGLVYERNPTALEIAAKTLSFTDLTPDSQRGANLYTNPNSETILQANYQPPLAADIAAFKGCLFYGNTVSKHRLTFNILAVGGSNGIALDDVLTINGVTYTAKAAENVASRHFALVTSGTVGQNIADTALSLVRVINQSASNTIIYAYYLSSFNDLPGKILLEERAIGGSAFSVIASAHPGAYNPAIPSSGTTVSSVNDAYKNAVAISKSGNPWAVPLTNILFLGSAAKKILRVIPLRDSVIVLKEDGFWRIIGEPGSFRQESIDSTAILIAPESAVVLNNSIWALTTQGVCSITDSSGVAVKSYGIEITISELIGANLDGIREFAFGLSYESDRKYYLFLPSNSTDTFPTQAFVFNTFTNAWVRHTISCGAGIVDPSTDRLYLAKSDSKYVTKERKSFSFRDYIDEGEANALSVVNAKTLTLSGGVSGVAVGDLVYQSDTLTSQISAVDVTLNRVEVRDVRNWTLSACTIFKGIDCVVEYIPHVGGNAGALKHWQEATVLFSNNSFPVSKVGFTSDLSGSLEETEIAGVSSAQWGLFQWGLIPWSATGNNRPNRVYVPLEKARSSQLTVRYSHKAAYSLFRLTGLSLVFDAVSERVVK